MSKFKIETDLDSVKSTALAFLNTDLKVNEKFGFIIHHPFINSPINALIDEKGETSLVDITKNPDDLNKVINNFEQVINSLDKALNVFLMANKPYTGVLFKYINVFLNEKDYNDILRYIWVHTECPNKDVNVSVAEWLSFFKKASASILMTPEERDILSGFDDVLTIYRGTGDSPLKKALSWTTSKKVAERFASRFESEGVVYEAKINKKDILAYFDTGELEVIANYNKIFDVREL